MDRSGGMRLQELLMERFIRNANIAHYKKLLEEEQDESRREVIRKLLAEEETKETCSPSRKR